VRLELKARTGHPDFLGLPWERPLEEWDVPELEDVPRGISRHVVRFVRPEGQRLYALKELPRRLADREYRLLTALRAEGLPVVSVVGVLSGRTTPGGQELPAVLITEHLPYSLPYRLLFMRAHWAVLHDQLEDALVDLLVRLHLTGFLWGDCSLSNTLFRRDAGTLAAYLVDTETSELHPSLTDGQRAYDLDIAVTNIAGEMSDLAAAGMLSGQDDPFALALGVRDRYAQLWDELTREEVVPADERWRIDERLRRLNELGFDVDEVELIREEDGTVRLRILTQVIEKGHHRRRLRELTGLDVQEEQARRLLNDIAGYKAWVEQEHGRPLTATAAAARWVQEVFEPTVQTIPDEHRGKREPAQLFHEVLEHRWFLGERGQADLDLPTVVADYLEHVLPRVPEERVVVEPGPSSDAGADESDPDPDPDHRDPDGPDPDLDGPDPAG